MTFCAAARAMTTSMEISAATISCSYQEDFVNGDTDIVYFVDAADRSAVQRLAERRSDASSNTVLQYDANPLNTVASVYITVNLGGGQSAAIAVYGTTVAQLTTQIEYTL